MHNNTKGGMKLNKIIYSAASGSTLDLPSDFLLENETMRKIGKSPMKNTIAYTIWRTGLPL